MEGGADVELLTVEHLSFFYPEQGTPALDGVSFSIPAGAFAVLCGPSGCGKSTLLRQLKPAVAPHGRRGGEIWFDGAPLDQMDARTQAQRIGFVQQSAEHQIVTDKVWHELAFGLESLGCDTPAIRRRVAEMAAFFGIEDWFHKSVTELSGGQKQLLNLASVMVMQPDLLILDEPTSQLDPIAAGEFLSALGKINRELGTTILLTEHRLEETLLLATTVMVMELGRLLCSGTAQEVGQRLKEADHPMFLAMPAAMRVWAAVETDAPCPVTVREGRDWLARFVRNHEIKPLPVEREYTYPPQPVVRVDQAWFRYERDGADIVRDLSLEVRRGEFLALLGGNGAGKTTTLKLLAGLRRPYRGEVEICGTVGFLPQDPKTLFVKKTVREELAGGDADVVALCRLEGLLERHPYDLSGGEQQRLALAKVLCSEPNVLLLDEPTKGLDAEFKRVFAGMLQTLLHRGVTVVMVSHDVEFCARYAHRCALFFDGSIAAQGTPRGFFSGNRFYTTGAHRMARGIIDGAVTAEDVIFACGGALPEEAEVPEQPVPHPEQEECSPCPERDTPAPGEKRKLSRRTKLAAALLLLLIPATLFVGETCFGGRQYRLIALLLLLEMMVPFFLVFEGRKPQTRELVLITCLCAIGVAGRAAFFMLPECKPVLALTVIAGVAFGGETGFLVGAVTMLCSNMLFGQGPWMPWQMFAMGIIGFLAGVLFRGGLLRRSRAALCAFGAASAILIYGGIMNPASALMAGVELNGGTLAAYYATGFPVDCVHAAATGLFLWFGAEPMLEKLDRIKVKYGLVK